jgi:hypothetical protein
LASRKADLPSLGLLTAATAAFKASPVSISRRVGMSRSCF